VRIKFRVSDKWTSWKAISVRLSAREIMELLRHVSVVWGLFAFLYVLFVFIYHVLLSDCYEDID
jgi:hypothetical protein